MWKFVCPALPPEQRVQCLHLHKEEEILEHLHISLEMVSILILAEMNELSTLSPTNVTQHANLNLLIFILGFILHLFHSDKVLQKINCICGF